MEEKQWLEQGGKRNLVAPSARVLKAISRVNLDYLWFCNPLLPCSKLRQMHVRIVFFIIFKVVFLSYSRSIFHNLE